MKKRPWKSMIALALQLISMALIGISLLVPWWAISTTYDTRIGGADNIWYHYQFTESIIISSNTVIYSNSTFPDEIFDTGCHYLGNLKTNIAGYDINSPSLFIITTVLTLIPLFMIGYTTLLIFYFFKRKPWNRVVFMTIGMIAFILCLIAPAYFIVQFPSTLGSDTTFKDAKPEADYRETVLDYPTIHFKGEYNDIEGNRGQPFTSQKWGPALGWYLPIVSAGAILLSIFLFILERVLPEPRRPKAPRRPPELRQVHKSSPQLIPYPTPLHEMLGLGSISPDHFPTLS